MIVPATSFERLLLRRASLIGYIALSISRADLGAANNNRLQDLVREHPRWDLILLRLKD